MALLVGVGGSNAAEYDHLYATLISLGYDVTTTIDSNVDVLISGPGNFVDVFADKPYIQISDWGDSGMNIDYISLGEDTPVTVTLTGSSPIFTGIDVGSWTSVGFWSYGTPGDYIGWVTEPDLALASLTVGVDTYSGALAINSAGDRAFIGWGIYGSEANANDFILLSNVINYVTGTPIVPEPSTYASIAGVLVLGAAVYTKRRKRST